MKKSILMNFVFLCLLLTVQTKGCIVSDDILWVKITSTSWENAGPEIEYNESENSTLFTFSGVGTFNNPHKEDFKVTHSDGCGWKPFIKYTSNSSIDSKLEGISQFPLACFQALMPIDYPSGKTNFDTAGGILFPGELDTLPLGYYEISIFVPEIASSENEDISSIIYFIQSDGEVIVMNNKAFCGLPSETTNDTTLGLELINFILPSILLISAIIYYRRLK